MGALIAGATDAPITGILIVFEMTNDYAIMLPLMLTVVIAHFVARRLEPESLYSGWLRRQGEHLEHGRDQDVLRALRVRDAYERSPVVFRADQPADEMLDQLGPGDQATFPVVNRDGSLLGVVTTAQLGQIARDQHARLPVLVAADLAEPTETITLADDLLEAIRRLGVRGTPALPVVEAGTTRLIGLVSRSHILTVYERTLSGAGLGTARSRWSSA
jgi:CIC family chloride channel protein